MNKYWHVHCEVTYADSGGARIWCKGGSNIKNPIINYNFKKESIKMEIVKTKNNENHACDFFFSNMTYSFGWYEPNFMSYSQKRNRKRGFHYSWFSLFSSWCFLLLTYIRKIQNFQPEISILNMKMHPTNSFFITKCVQFLSLSSNSAKNPSFCGKGEGRMDILGISMLSILYQ